MSAEQFITDNLDIWTSAIKSKATTGRGSNKKIELYGIKKLRELILDLAVRGLLVPQDPEDEPASVLLESVKSKKHSLFRERNLREDKELYKCSAYFNTPESWSWACVGEVSHVLGGKRVPRGYKLRDIKTRHAYIRVTDMKNHTVLMDDLKYIEDNIFSQISKYVINKDDVYITIAGTIGATGEIPNCLDGMNLTENAAKLVFSGINKQFLILAISSYYIQEQFSNAVNQMAQPKLSLASIKHTNITLPPLAEQHRIATKVDELMLLCDHLEQQTENCLAAHQTLVQTLLDTLTTTSDQNNFTAAWNRIEQHFDTLFTTENSIDQLKQAILQLAVMGKLVPQDPNDEPASKLLERIAIEKEQLIKEGKIRKQKPLPPISEDEKPLELPEGWELTRFGELINLVSGQHLKPDEYSEVLKGGMIPYLTGPAEFGKRHPKASRYTLERRSVASLGDLLITCKGSGVGKLNEADQEIFISRQLMAIQPIMISLGYSMLLAKSLNEHLRASIVGIAIPGISREDVTDAVVCLPPRTEQCLIVEIVNKLMAICDALEIRINTAQTTQLRLADAMAEQALEQ